MGKILNKPKKKLRINKTTKFTSIIDSKENNESFSVIWKMRERRRNKMKYKDVKKKERSLMNKYP